MARVDLSTPPAAAPFPEPLLRHLAETMAVLYPPPFVVQLPSARGLPCTGTAAHLAVEYLVLPHRRRPVLLVPTYPSRFAATALRGAKPATARQRRRVALLAGALAATLALPGAGRLLWRDRVRVYGRRSDDCLITYLQSHSDAAAMAVHVGGAARANRKPVVQLLDVGGDTIGYAKVGMNQLTRTLVRAEYQALRALAAAKLRHTIVPEVRHTGRWRDHEVLVQSALPVWRPSYRRATDTLVTSMLEVARACGIRTGRLASSGYWATLEGRLAGISGREGGRTLGGLALDLLAHAGDIELEYGAWHGDWAPWNCHPLPGTMLVWDWERFTTGVPVGFDAVHYGLSESLAGDGGHPERATEALLARAPKLLAPFQVPPHAAGVVALLYLIDIATRYLHDRQGAGGAPLGAVGEWLLPTLVRHISRLAGHTGTARADPVTSGPVHTGSVHTGTVHTGHRSRPGEQP